MSVFGDNTRRRNRLIDRALGFRRGSSGQELDQLLLADPDADVESYDRAASALHVALLPVPHLPIPEPTLRRLKKRAKAGQQHHL
jgi:hypothetical protein